jgi:hypothetical protein
MKAHLVFVDESGFLMAPLVRRTWAPCGQTPLHYQRTRHHRKVSAIAALLVSPGRQRVRLCFRLHPDTNLRAGELIAFLRQLLGHVRGPVVLIWDRWRPHRARLLEAFVARCPRLHVEFLPPYAPELNAVEYLWAWLKANALANQTPTDLAPLLASARQATRAAQRAPDLLRSFVAHCPLPLRLA